MTQNDAHVSFNVLEGNFGKKFEKFVREAREKLCDNKTPFEKFHEKAYLIVRLLIAPEESLHLYIRRDDIYLAAVRVLEVGWYEFKRSEENFFFPEATDELPFDGSYGKADFKLSQNYFATAVSNLISGIKSTNKDTHLWRGHILRIIVFVSEAIRIDHIAKFIIQMEPEKEFTPFVEWMIHNWGKMSDSASGYVQQPPEATTADEEEIIQGIGERYKKELIGKPKLCAIVLGDGIRCGYLKEDSVQKKNLKEGKKRKRNK